MKNNSVYILSFILKFLLLAILVFLIVSGIALVIFTYEEITDGIISMMEIENKREALLNNYLTRDKFTIVRITLISIVFIYGLMLFRIFPRISAITSQLQSFLLLKKGIIISASKAVLQLSPLQKALALLLFLFILLYRLWNLFEFPLLNDELFTYLYFVKPGFFSAISYYPGPNNHVFYSVVACIVDLFTDNERFILRLPSYLAGLLTAVIIFIYFLKRRSFAFAFLTALFYSGFLSIFYYSFHGRGYSFEYLFFVLLLISVLEILKEKNESFWKVLLICSSVLGFYSIPVFLYPFLSVAVFVAGVLLHRKNYTLLRKFINWTLLSGLITIFLYLPVFIVSGLNAVIGNSFVKPLSSTEFFTGIPAYLKSVTSYWWGNEWGAVITILILLLSFSVLWFSGYKKWLWLTVCCFLIPAIILIFQRVHPFPRVWDYLLLVIAIILAFIFNYLLVQIKNVPLKYSLITTLFLVVCFYQFYSIQEFKKGGFKFYTIIISSLEKALQFNIQTAYVGEETYFLYFKLYNEKLHREVEIQSNPSGYLPDLVILPVQKELNYPENQYVLLENDGFARIWLKKR